MERRGAGDNPSSKARSAYARSFRERGSRRIRTQGALTRDQSECLKRRAKFQRSARSACLGRGAMATCGLDDKCCNDALQAGLAKRR
eukprot:914108-Pleurochrysis_carterae.AAC.1